ncbi:MAG: hypothetical protein GC159_05645 [Phycisphaera sp.]|nr:hypothetical protein [Phycisphaera sp.]
MFYVGGDGDQQLRCVYGLSDGSFLIGGGASDLAWLPASTPRIELGGAHPKSDPTGMTPFILHLSADLKPLRVVTLPKDSAQDVKFIKATSVPGAKTGDLYISGTRDGKDRDGGYFVARLDGNFVDAPPTKLTWCVDVGATGPLRDDQAWDVGSDGKVVYATGEPYSYNWMAVHRLKADGEMDVVEHWRTHWTGDGEWAGTPASAAPSPVTYSGIVLKIWKRGDFRSWTREDFLAKSSDGNGGEKQGRWPFDAMFPGYYDPASKETVDVTGTKKGYYGYRWGTTPSAHVGTIAIDRRDNRMYLGGNNKSKLPDGKPDFEPWVIAMDKDGQLLWWQRLYPESKGVSTPDQFVDALTIDYTYPSKSAGSLVAVARAHGNNVNNYWQGDAIKHPDNPGKAFQNQFTGTHGNMHFSWIGRMTLDTGTMLHATYFAEFGEGNKFQDKRFSDPLLKRWPHFLAGWPELNSTRVEPTVRTDAAGNVYVVANGRRVITTSNAYQQMPSPLEDKDAKGVWSDFVRVYRPDLTGLSYSSLLVGKWDWATGEGASQVDLTGVYPTPTGVIVVGTAPVDKKAGAVTGNDMPTQNVPDWGKATRTGAMGVIGVLNFAK